MLGRVLPLDPCLTAKHLKSRAGDDVGEEGHRRHERHDDHVAVAEVADLVRKDRPDFILVQLFEEAPRDYEFGRGHGSTEDEGVGRGISALPDLRPRNPPLTRRVAPRLVHPGVRLRRDGLPVPDRPPHDRGRNRPLDIDEKDRDADDDRERVRERVALEDEVDDYEDREEEQGQRREHEEEGEGAAPPERVEGSHANGYIRPSHERCAGMPELVESLNCPKCGGPLNLTTGEVIVTCPYCGTASRMEGGKPFILRHSMLAARP